MHSRAFTHAEFIEYMRDQRMEPELLHIQEHTECSSEEFVSGVEVMGDDTGRVSEIVYTYVDSTNTITRMQAIPVDSLGYGRGRL